MKKFDPDKYFTPFEALDPCFPLIEPCKPIEEPCRPIEVFDPCTPLDEDEMTARDWDLLNFLDINCCELFPYANYTLKMIDDMIQEIEICPDGDIIPKNLDARYKLPRMDYFKIFFKKNGYRKDIAVAKELLKLYVQSPWHVINRAQNVQTSGDLLVLAKNLSFHKNLPTLDQISTIPDDLSKYTQVADASGEIQGKPWHIDRNPEYPRANCFALQVFEISALAVEIHLDPDEALGEKGWLRDEKGKSLPKGTKIIAGKIYTIPNIWITADLMEGGDIIDRGINIGGTIGRNFNTHKPDKAKEIMVKDLNNLIPKINKYAGHIYGMILYAHGTKSGYISNIANHLKFLIDWEVGNFKKLHTMRLLDALKQNGFRIANAYPMQCFSIFKGDFTFTTGDVFYKGKKYLAQEVISSYIRKIRKDSGLTPGLCYSDSNGEESVTYSVDWKREWKRRAIKVDGYSGVNVIGIDL